MSRKRARRPTWMADRRGDGDRQTKSAMITWITSSCNWMSAILIISSVSDGPSFPSIYAPLFGNPAADAEGDRKSPSDLDPEGLLRPVEPWQSL